MSWRCCTYCALGEFNVHNLSIKNLKRLTRHWGRVPVTVTIQKMGNGDRWESKKEIFLQNTLRALNALFAFNLTRRVTIITFECYLWFFSMNIIVIGKKTYCDLIFSNFCHWNCKQQMGFLHIISSPYHKIPTA